MAAGMWGFGPDAAATSRQKDAAWATADACPVEIRGATGQFGDAWTNGLYEVDVTHPEIPPVYVLQGGHFERFLYFDAEHYWRVGSCEYKDQEKAAAGSMRSAEKVRPGTLPTQVAAWSVRTGYDEWLLQDVEVRATAKAVEQGLAVGAAVSANGAGETKGYNR
ncbi:unnamed protein product [Durusdinium trenchii]|uniref:Uncharacterized protein n=2 Tax=Durusdinium trenchii TaxID=1381693 RepID=A0ABP0MJ35_9DINO